jgi:hypothetical protein
LKTDEDAQSASSSRLIRIFSPVGLGRGAQAKADQGSRLFEPGEC